MVAALKQEGEAGPHFLEQDFWPVAAAQLTGVAIV
jgi:hypothetical protein